MVYWLVLLTFNDYSTKGVEMQRRGLRPIDINWYCVKLYSSFSSSSHHSAFHELFPIHEFGSRHEVPNDRHIWVCFSCRTVEQWIQWSTMTYVLIHVLIYLHSLCLLVSEMYIYIYTYICVYIYTFNLHISICWTIHTHIASNRHVNILIIWWSLHISGFYQQWFLFPNQNHTVSTIWMVNHKSMISISWQFLDMCVIFDMSFVDMVSNFHPFFSTKNGTSWPPMAVLWRWTPSVRLRPPR